MKHWGTGGLLTRRRGAVLYRGEGSRQYLKFSAALLRSIHHQMKLGWTMMPSTSCVTYTCSQLYFQRIGHEEIADCSQKLTWRHRSLLSIDLQVNGQVLPLQQFESSTLTHSPSHAQRSDPVIKRVKDVSSVPKRVRPCPTICP